MEQTHMTNKSEQLKLEGAKRARIEQSLLKLLFNGFASLKFLNSDTDEILALRELCELNQYTSIALKHNDYGYKNLSEKAKECFDVLLALTGLEKRGLIERETHFTNEDIPEDDPIELSYKTLRLTNAWTLSWFAEALITNEEKESFITFDQTDNSPPRRFFFEYLQYQLTSKGYDVALKFQEHEDAEKRYVQQQELATKAANSANSSSKTAKRALFAAAAIALGSIGNLALNAYMNNLIP
tara:strand:- start:2301 stop:3023 length:723 start_codon:yes stop_codon:yes gene_type:complete